MKNHMPEESYTTDHKIYLAAVEHHWESRTDNVAV